MFIITDIQKIRNQIKRKIIEKRSKKYTKRLYAKIAHKCKIVYISGGIAVLYDRKDGTVCEQCFLRVYPISGGKVLRKYACEVNSYCQEEEMLEKLQNVRLFHETPRKSRDFVFGATIGYSELKGIARPQDVMARASIAYQAASSGIWKTVMDADKDRNKNIKTGTVFSGPCF